MTPEDAEISEEKVSKKVKVQVDECINIIEYLFNPTKQIQVKQENIKKISHQI